MKLSILIPIYNERRWVEPLRKALETAPLDRCRGITGAEILFVDDGSTDGTTELVADLASRPFRFACGMVAPVRALFLGKNRGKGVAIREAIQASTGDIVLVQDADLEYSPLDYPVLLAPFVDQEADAVFGSRFVGNPRRILYFWHSLLNRFLTLLSNMLNDVNLTDMETGYKVMRGSLARKLRLVSNRFGIEPELTSRLAKARIRLYEVPIRYQGRTYAEGKKIRAKDGVAALFHILRFGLWDTEPYAPGLAQTLEALDGASDRIYRPLIEGALGARLTPKRNARILEIGAGIGAVTSFLVDRGHVTATDLSGECVERLRHRFSQVSDFRALAWDATTPFPGPAGFDVVVASNVLEHLPDDTASLRAWRDLLAEDGVLVLVVPHYPSLFSPADRAVGHFRRYDRKRLDAALRGAGLVAERVALGNPLAVLGWAWNCVVRQKADLPQGQIRLYAMLKPILSPVERVLSRFMGLNLVCTARRARAASAERSAA